MSKSMLPNHLNIEGLPNSNYPEKVVHTVLLSLAICFEAILRRPEDLSAVEAIEFVSGQFQTVADNVELNSDERKVYDELVRRFRKYWNSCR